MTQKIWIVNSDNAIAVDLRPLASVEKMDADEAEKETEKRGYCLIFNEHPEANYYVRLECADGHILTDDACDEVGGVIDVLFIGCGTMTDRDLVYDMLVRSLLIGQTNVIDLRGVKAAVRVVLIPD